MNPRAGQFEQPDDVLAEVFPEDFPQLDQQEKRDQRRQDRRQPAQKKPPEVVAKADFLEVGLDFGALLHRGRRGRSFRLNRYWLAHAFIIAELPDSFMERPAAW